MSGTRKESYMYGSGVDKKESERYLSLLGSRSIEDEEEEVETVEERALKTVFASQLHPQATEHDVYQFFSKAGKVRDVRLNRRSIGSGYIEFYDVISVSMAITLSGSLLLGHPVLVKQSESEKNTVQSSPAFLREVYVGNLPSGMTKRQLRQIFEVFGPVNLVQLCTDSKTGKDYGFIRFSECEHAKEAQRLNRKLKISDRTLEVFPFTEHVRVQYSRRQS